jgi:hypothetical protein
MYTFYIVSITEEMIITFWEQEKNKKWRKHKNATLDRLSTSYELGEGNTPHDHELQFAKFEEIAQATDNFSETCKIGQGGFGNVYKVHYSFINLPLSIPNLL